MSQLSLAKSTLISFSKLFFIDDINIFHHLFCCFLTKINYGRLESRRQDLEHMVSRHSISKTKTNLAKRPKHF